MALYVPTYSGSDLISSGLFLDIACTFARHPFVCYHVTEANWLWQDLDRGQVYSDLYSSLLARTQSEYNQLVEVAVVGVIYWCPIAIEYLYSHQDPQ